MQSLASSESKAEFDQKWVLQLIALKEEEAANEMDNDEESKNMREDASNNDELRSDVMMDLNTISKQTSSVSPPMGEQRSHSTPNSINNNRNSPF